MIAGLARLGQSLGYSVEEERLIGGSGAAVDLAWYAADNDDVPLIVFEVESSASASMANNAMKVLSRDTDDFVKPLFFFHVLLGGGADNDRIAGLRSQWGKHNYRVYRLNEDAELLRLVCDVFAQHRRISRTVNVREVAKALSFEPWSRLDRPSVLRTLEELKFEANYLLFFAEAALDEAEFRPEYLRRLARTSADDRLELEQYGTYLGDGFPNILDIAILIGARLIPEGEAVKHLEAWQTRSGYMRTVGPYFGLSRDYDQHVIGIAPFIYGVAGLLMARNESAYAWIVDDLYSILNEARERWSFEGPLAIPTALWLAHLASAGTVILPSIRRDRLARAYDLASDVIGEVGGVPKSVVDCPPCYVDIWEPDAWKESLRHMPVDFPTSDELNARYEESSADDLWADPERAAIALACKEDWPTWSTRGLIVALRAERLRDRFSTS